MTPPPVFDPVIHAPGRLQICAILSSVDEAEFALIRDTIKVSDSVLSKHLKQLEDAGYITLTKTPVDGRSMGTNQPAMPRNFHAPPGRRPLRSAV